MSLEATAQSAPQSAPQEQPSTVDAPAADAKASAPTGGSPAPAADAKASAPVDKPDWRARMAGSDTKALETLSRYPSEGDLLKAFMEQRSTLSKRAQPMTLADNATPDQVAEYRKAIGVPDIAKDAKPEAYIEAYKITPPEGYTPSKAETGMISDFAKRAYEKGLPPAAVKEATDFFFQEQVAVDQAIRKVSLERQKEWTNSLRDELGSKEFETQAAATEAWIKAEFNDDPNGLAEILNTQMPGGGRLGDHPWMFKQMAKAAMGNGFTDRIEANALESGGKSLAQQQQEIEGLRSSDPKRYAAADVQTRYDKILELRVQRGEIDEQGRPITRR